MTPKEILERLYIVSLKKYDVKDALKELQQWILGHRKEIKVFKTQEDCNKFAMDCLDSANTKPLFNYLDKGGYNQALEDLSKELEG